MAASALRAESTLSPTLAFQWTQAAEGDQENPPHGLNLNEIEFLLNLTNNLVRFLAKV